jgi:hypothetical protein
MECGGSIGADDVSDPCRGRLTGRLAAALQGMTLHASAVNFLFTGEVKDQSQLCGQLDRLRDLGLELISVQPQTESGRATDEDQTAR